MGGEWMGGEVFFFFPNWTMVQGKILIVDNLKCHKKIIIDWCFMCKACEEMVNHFLYCATARTLGKYFSIFWIFWAMPNLPRNLLACWRGGFKTSKWWCVKFCTFMHIAVFGERNGRLFVEHKYHCVLLNNYLWNHINWMRAIRGFFLPPFWIVLE